MANCKSELELGDDYGDNSTTFHCQLEEGHKGKHQEEFESYENGLVKINWEKE